MSNEIPRSYATGLVFVLDGLSLDSDFKSEQIDIHNANVAFIQASVDGTPNDFNAYFSIEVSNVRLDDERMPNAYVPYPGSERFLNATCNNFGWEFRQLTFRYLRICYNAESNTLGTVTANIRARRT